MSADPRRHLWASAFILPGLTLALALGFSVGVPADAIAFMPLLFVFVVLPLGDALLGCDLRNADPQTRNVDGYYDGLMMAIIAAYALAIAAACWLVTATGFTWWQAAVFAIGSGYLHSTLIVAGHELGHRASGGAQRSGALLALGLVGYSHFTIEHNQGHHVHVATPEDPASAFYGESLYAFALREIPGVLKGGLRCERERLARKGLPFWGADNRILHGWSLGLLFAVLLAAWLGWQVLPFVLLHHFMCWFAVTTTNYIEHYGILRERLSARYEPVRACHSWNASHRLSNLLLFHFQRHCDHHVHPGRPYPLLQHHADAPQLPSGYPGCFLLALIPPLWRATMHPRFERCFGADLKRRNLRPMP